MKYIILDVEANGLLDTATKIHCLSYESEGKIYSLTSYSDMKKLLEDATVFLVGHEVIRYDIPLLEKILEIKINNPAIDTLGLSWYLFPERKVHGLLHWGKELGIAKPEIEDWDDLSVEKYIYRCEEDVKITSKLFQLETEYLQQLYGEDYMRIVGYLSFKLECAREQRETRIKIDKKKILQNLQILQELEKEKIDALALAMPKSITFREYNRPTKFYKIDGHLTNAAKNWLNILNEQDLPEDYDDTVMVKVSEENGNPTSTTQIKDWLYGLGWEPHTFLYRKNTKGEVNKIAQIYTGDNSVCPSIEILYSIEPNLQNLDRLSLIQHRKNVLKSFLAIEKDGYVTGEIQGFTNTLRFKHAKPIANLPNKNKFYGELIRGSIITEDENHVLCGADMTALEDTTKQHYMYFFDPDYVTQMRVPGFDPHLDIAVLSGMLTPEQVQQHKNKEVDYSQIRNKAKTVNFAGIYGAGPPKIAQTTGMSLEQATQLHTTYWERNKAVKLVAKNLKTKTVHGQMWLYNPVSKFWYSLRFEKDKFSTLNQGTGVYCFDSWIREVRKRGIKIMLQYHDEIAFDLPKNMKDFVKKILLESIDKVNQQIRLNVPLSASVDFGDNYAQIH